jgi:hypothetical protein
LCWFEGGTTDSIGMTLFDGALEMASWNRVAIRFTPDGDVVDAVTSEPGAWALKV